MALSDTPIRTRRGFDPAFAAALAALVCAAPLIAVAALAFSSADTDYLQHLIGTRLPVFLASTFTVGLIAALAAAGIGVTAAWLTARCDFPGARFFAWALVLPLAVPAYVAAYAWLDLTQQAGPIASWLRDISPALGRLVPAVRGDVGTGLISALVLYPYVFLLARQAFAGQSAEAYEAARTLGDGPLAAFRRAALPMARPAIAAGLALVLMETLADYGAAAHLGAQTLSVGIVRAWSGAGSLPDAARLALVLVTLSLLIFSLERGQRRRARASNASGRTRPPARFRLTGLQAAMATLFCALPLLFGLLIPMARLGYRAFNESAARGVLEAVWNSVSLAAGAAAIAALLGLGAAYAIRSGKPVGVISARLAGLGYAAPGAVAAVGVLAFMGAAQGLIDPTWRSLTGEVFPLLLTSGIGALMLAYLSRFAAAAIGPAESALMRITPALDGASRTLGAGPLETVRRVHWPLAASGVAAAALLVFVEVLKELPATMILRPFNFDTLAVVAHNYASDERLGQAALPSLAIILVALPAMALLARGRMSRDDALPGETG
jgi:iron(III) transport system permease protein